MYNSSFRMCLLLRPDEIVLLILSGNLLTLPGRRKSVGHHAVKTSDEQEILMSELRLRRHSVSK